MTSQSSSALDFQTLFESIPGLYLVLKPDAPQFTIVAVSDAYLQATKTKRAEILGRGLFEVFPDNPDDPLATGVQNLRASLETVLQTRTADVMAFQKYDIQRPESEGGGFEERYWSPVNSPVFNADQEIIQIIHRAEDVTEFVQLQQQQQNQRQENQALRDRTQQMAAEVYLSARELRGVNQQLRDANCTLLQREIDLRLITDAVPALVSFVDAEQRYQFNNREYEVWFGQTAATMKGKHLRELMGESAYAAIRPYVEQVLAGERVSFESEIFFESMGSRYISATYVPQFSDRGTVRGFVALVSDLSQRKQVEAALWQSDERLKIAQQAANAGIWDWEIDTDQVTWSQEYYLVYGLDPETTTPSYENWLASIVAADRDRVDQATCQAMEHGTDLNVEFRIQHPVKGTRWLTAIGQTFCDANGQPRRMTGIALDITARKQAEEALRQSESRFQTLVKNMPGMAYRYVPQTNETGTFTYVSSGSRELFELDPETILQNAESLWALIHPDDLPGLQSSVAIAFENSQPWQWEGRIITPSGQLKWIQGRSRVEQTDDGKVWDGLLFDITDRKKAEAEREQLLAREQSAREAAEAANRIKDEFLAVLSHELRSPLNPILGWAKLLQTKTLDDARTQEALGIIERNAKLQANLVEDLLNVSRILRGKLSLNISPVNLATIIQAAIETVHPAAEAKSIRIQKHIAPHVGRVSGDPSRLQQVVWNLLSNAVKFTPRGGQVVIRLEQLGAQAQMTVRDTGKGVTPEFLPYVFDYFRQADAGTTRSSGGLGLGLAIARHLVELHGGTIQAESPGVGQGATFTIQLPLRQSQPQAHQVNQQTEPAVNLVDVKVLVVDDEADTRAFVSFLLEQHGAQVKAVASAREALMACLQFKPDVLLSDIGMPEMDGYMLLKQLRTLPPKQGGLTPAIALTAYAGTVDHRQAIAAGFQRHLPKPVEPADLLTAVASLAADRRNPFDWQS